LKQETVD